MNGRPQTPAMYAPDVQRSAPHLHTRSAGPARTGTYLQVVRLGDWRDVLGDVDGCDLLFSDPPFSAQTDQGYRSGSDLEGGGLPYAPIDPQGCHDAAAWWAPRVRRWAVLFGDDRSVAWWRSGWESAGWYTFPPVPWLRANDSPRMYGDGPASGVEYLAVARPRSVVRDRWSRAPWYVAQRAARVGGMVGVKDPGALVQVLRDYSRPGDVVVDPYAGTASIGEACIGTGRGYLGAEVDPRTFTRAAQRFAQLEAVDEGGPDRGAELEAVDAARRARGRGVNAPGLTTGPRRAVRCPGCGWATKRRTGPCSHAARCYRIGECGARWGLCSGCGEPLAPRGRLTAKQRLKRPPHGRNGTESGDFVDV